MAACAIACFWFPLRAIDALPSKNYNEGWNAYRQWMAVQGQPLFGAPSPFWNTNYPFLSFHIVGLLGRTKDHMVLAGRSISFASMVAVAALLGGIIRAATGSWAAAVYAGLLLAASLGGFDVSGRVVDDPELLSAAFATFGLFAYLRAKPGLLWPALAALAFCCSLFTKHDYIMFPLSVALHLLLTRNWRAFAVFAATGIAVAAALLALSWHLDGRHFLAEFLRKRAYGLPNAISETAHYLLHFSVPMLIGAAVLWRASGMANRRLLLILLVLTNLAAIGFAGGNGVAANIFYPAVIADLLACVTALCWLQQHGGHFAAALIAASLAGAIGAPSRVYHDRAAQSQLAAASAAARQAIAVLQATHGPAICEDLLLCFYAGKPMAYDPYYVKDQIGIGHLREAGIVALLAAHHYAAIQADGIEDSAGMAPLQRRFTAGFRQALYAAYRPALVNRFDLIFVPKP